MLAKYAEAIARLLAAARSRIANQADLTDADVVRGLCGEFSSKLVKQFPELKEHFGDCNGWEHWWTTTPDGEIVDGTAIQFGPGPYTYNEVDLATEEVCIGRCMNCGEDIMGLMSKGRQCICSEKCSQEYAKYCLG